MQFFNKEQTMEDSLHNYPPEQVERVKHPPETPL